MALSATHNLLTLGAWEQAPLHDLIAVELEPYSGREHSQVSATGPRVDLSPRQTISLGMIFHELATNAAKYGALSAPTGKVLITWELSTDRVRTILDIHWQERGGPPVKPPIRRGFGSRLIEQSVAHELGGKFRPTYGREGFQCIILIPMVASAGP